MNLLKNVDGDWEKSKNRIRQDLDTIQRNINQILAQINAPVAAIPDPPAVIAPNKKIDLGGVITAGDGALSGDGTISAPLQVNVDGTTVTVNSANKLVAAGGLSSVSVAAAGALSGDGTSGTPLAVKVDGVTITINGSNNLAVTGITLNHTQSADFAANIPGGTTVSGLIAAPGASIITLPLIAVAQTKYTGYTTGRSLSLRYNGNTTDEILLANVIGGGGVASTGKWVYGLAQGPFNRSVGTIDNKAIDIIFSGANSAFTAGDKLTVDVWYVTYSLTI